jgi:hypothetical protein
VDGSECRRGDPQHKHRSNYGGDKCASHVGRFLS